VNVLSGAFEKKGSEVLGIPKKRKCAARCNAGIRIVEQDVPELVPGTIAIDVKASLVSPGTELGGGWHALAAARDAGAGQDELRPIGYSNAGVVIAAGEDVTRHKPGDRVACIGAGYAMHATTAIIPVNLSVTLPDSVTFAQGSYAMLSATAMHAIRRGETRLGERVAVVGLGLVGQLSAQLSRLCGAYVIGWDVIPLRLKIAESWGIDAAVNPGAEDAVAKTRAWTNGYGLDHAILATSGNGDEAVPRVLDSMKISPDGHPEGIVVVVGGTSFRYNAGMTNIDVRRASRTGPGYHDENWELGADYPPVFMRWSTQTNLALCMQLIAEGRLNVDCLTTHRIPLGQAEEAIDKALNTPDEMLGVVFEM